MELIMSEITSAMVKELREKTGVGMMDCKLALKENNGNIEASIDWLRTKGIAKACLLYTSPSPRDPWKSRMPSSA